MRKRVELRTLTTEEVSEIKRLAASRKESIRLVQRARIIALMYEKSRPCMHPKTARRGAGFRSATVGAGCRSNASTNKGCSRFAGQAASGAAAGPPPGARAQCLGQSGAAEAGHARIPVPTLDAGALAAGV